MTHGPSMQHGIILAVLAIALMAFVVARLAISARGKARARRSPGPEPDRRAHAVDSAPAPVNSHGVGQQARTAGPADAMVSVDGLTKRYGNFLAIDRLTFSLDRGTVTGFLGPNGAGKTTTLRLILGLAEPTSGEALVLGRPYAELETPTRRVGAVLESNDFHPGRSGRDHLRVLALAAELPRSRVEEVLDLVALGPAAGQLVKTYSLGMRQRLGLATALLGEPELLMLDEPTNGLDPVGVHWLRGFLRSFAEGGGTVLVSSHLLAEVAQSVDRVLIIDHGRLVADAPLDELAGRGHSLEDAYLDLTAGGLS